jgi:hypothetical protein
MGTIIPIYEDPITVISVLKDDDNVQLGISQSTGSFSVTTNMTSILDF